MAISTTAAKFRKAAFAFALCAASAFAATYKDFYRVDDWKDPELTGTAYYVDAYGKVKSWNYQLKPSGSGGYKAAIDDAGDQDANSAYWTAIQASIAAGVLSSSNTMPIPVSRSRMRERSCRYQ